MELDKNRLLALYPEYTSVLGPYDRQDGRKHVILNNNNVPTGTKGKTKTISYPKALVEAHTGKRLSPNETVDHIDRDFTNDRIENFAIRDRKEHGKLDALYSVVSDVHCKFCERLFTPTRNQINNRSKTKAGPFCSRKCSGGYGALVQNTGVNFGRDEILVVKVRPNK